MKKLSRQLAEALNHFHNAPGNTLSTYDFMALGIYSPSQVISRLKKVGVKIKTTYKAALDPKSNLRTRIAHYQFQGWMHE